MGSLEALRRGGGDLEREPGMIYLLVRSEIITYLLGSESRFGRRDGNFEMLEQKELNELWWWTRIHVPGKC